MTVLFGEKNGMPSRKKPLKKKKKKREPVREVQFDYYFDDTTMLEADGDFKVVKRIFEKDPNRDGKRIRNIAGVVIISPLVQPDWVIKSNLSVFHPLGRGEFVLDFYHDRRVVIAGFGTSTPDRFQNPDIRFLTMWCQEKGWKIPEVTESVVRQNPSFWKHMWETLIVDSEYLDNLYGPRRGMGMRETQDDDDEETEDI